MKTTRTVVGGGQKRLKLLAAFAVLAVAFAALTVIPAVAEDSDAEVSSATPIASADAFVKAVVADGETAVTSFNVVLTSDITLAQRYTISGTGTIDLAGYKITLSSVQTNDTSDDNKDDARILITGDVTIKGTTGSIEKTTAYKDGAVLEESSAVNVVGEDALLTLESGKISCTSTLGYGIYARNGGDVTVNGGTVIGNASAMSGNNTEATCNFTINGGTITSMKAVAVYFPANGKLSVTGGTFNGTGGFDIREGTASISNATINLTVAGSNATRDDYGMPFNIGVGVYGLDGGSYGNPSVALQNITVKATSGVSKICDVYFGVLKDIEKGSNVTFNEITVGYKSSNLVKNSISLTVADAAGAELITLSNPTGNGTAAMIDLVSNGVKVLEDSRLNCTVDSGDNSMTVTNILAGDDGITLTRGSIAIAGDVKYDSTAGTVVINGSATLTGDVDLEQVQITINSGASLYIPEGKTLTVTGTSTITASSEGAIVNAGTLSAGTATISVTGNNAIVATATSTTTVAAASVSNIAFMKGATINGESATESSSSLESAAASSFNALKGFVKADVKEITASGAIDITENFTLPEGFVLIGNNSELITVKENVKFTNEGKIVSAGIFVQGIFENVGTVGDKEYKVAIEVGGETSTIGAATDSRCYVINDGVMYIGTLQINNVTNPRITEFTNAGELYLYSNTADDYADVEVAENAVFENTGSIYGEFADITGDGSFINTNGDVGCVVSTQYISGTKSVEEISGKTSGSRTYGALQELVVPEGKTWTISKANEITINGKLTVYGTLVVEGTLIIAGAGDGSNDAVLDVDGTMNVVKDAVLQIGKIDEITTPSPTTYEYFRASATIDGTFNLDGTLDIVCTPIVAEYDNYYDGFAVAGAMTVSKTGVIGTHYINDTNYYGVITVIGTLDVTGGFNNAQIINKGTVTIDNSKTTAVANGNVNIAMHANGAVLKVSSFKFYLNDAGTKFQNGLFVSDIGAILKEGKKTAGVDVDAQKIIFDTANFFAITGTEVSVSGGDMTAAAFVGEIVITESITSKTVTIENSKVTSFTNTMDVSGNASTSITYTKTGTGSDPVELEGAFVITSGGDAIDEPVAWENASNAVAYNYIVKGGVSVTDALTVGDNTFFANSGTLDVSGTITNLGSKTKAIVNATIDGRTGDITVTGLITSSNVITNSGMINAAHYVITTGTGDNEVTTYNYSSFGAAVKAVAVDGNKEDKIVTVMGAIVVEEDVTVPAGVSVVFAASNADNNSLTVGTTEDEGRDVEVIFTATATMTSGSEQVIVNGTLTFNDKTDDSTRDTVSDVTVEDEAETGARTYTNLYTALQGASAGQTVTVTKETGNVKITQSLTIPEGVTLFVPADAVSLLLDNGVTLTVDGTLKTELDILAKKMFGTTALNLDAVEGGDGEKRSSAIVVNGYLFVSLDVANNGLNYANSNAGENVSMIAGAPIYGAYYLYDTDWSAISPVEKALAVVDKIAGDITINGPIAVGDISFTGTDDCDRLVIADSSVTNKPANTDPVKSSLTANSVTIANGTFDATGTFNGSVIVAGATVSFVNAKTFTASVDTDGRGFVAGTIVKGVGEAKLAVTLAAGSLVAPTELRTEAPFTVAAGATLVAEGAIFETLKVAGTASVASNKTLTVNGTLSVLEGGVLDVAVATDTTAAGTASTTTLDVGMDSKKETTGAVATVNGPVDVTSKAFVVAGSTISAETQKVLDKMKSTQYNVNGALWMTVYAVSATLDVDEVTKAPVENAWFAGWENSKGETAKAGDYVGSTDWKIVDAVIKTEVYKIFVYANEGIANVYIDDNIMGRGYITVDGNQINGYIANVAAGEHKITYDLTNGWTGTAVFKVNGDSISGNSFATEGTPKTVTTAAGEKTFEAIEYTVQISGLEKSGYVPDAPDNEDTGMTITDYLLIVLVVLIIVMAIIVAMRMMRS